MASGHTQGLHVDHIGSLLRPQPLREARERLLGLHDANSNLGAHDNAELRAIEDKHVADVVAMQEAAGLSVVTDGEFRRRSWWTDFYLSLGGPRITYEGKSPYKFINADGDTRSVPALNIDRKITLRGSVNVAPFRHLKSVASRTPKVSLPGPPMLHFMRDEDFNREIYTDFDAFWADVIAAYRAEISDLADAGCRHLQIDECMLTFLCDERHREASRARGDDPDQLIDKYAEVINAAIAERPDDMVATMHMCRGNLNAYWGAEGGYEPIADAIFNRIDVDAYLLEYDTPRAGDFAPLRHLPKGKTVLLGLMSTKEAGLESEDELRRRIDEAADHVPHEQLGLCPQCGFSTNVFGTHFSIDDEKRKLNRLVEVADKVWGTA